MFKSEYNYIHDQFTAMETYTDSFFLIKMGVMLLHYYRTKYITSTAFDIPLVGCDTNGINRGGIISFC